MKRAKYLYGSASRIVGFKKFLFAIDHKILSWDDFQIYHQLAKRIIEFIIAAMKEFKD